MQKKIRCIYCNKKIINKQNAQPAGPRYETFYVCSDPCAIWANEFFKTLGERKSLFIGGAILVAMFIPIIIFTESYVSVIFGALAIALLGMLILMLPSVISDTTRWLGIRKSTKAGKIFGIAVMAMSPLVLIALFFV